MPANPSKEYQEAAKKAFARTLPEDRQGGVHRLKSKDGQYRSFTPKFKD